MTLCYQMDVKIWSKQKKNSVGQDYWRRTSDKWILGYRSLLMCGRFNITKMTALPKLIFRFNRIFIKSQLNFFYINWKTQLKMKKTQNTQTILKMNKTVEVMLSNFKTYYKAMVVWCWFEDRHRTIK